jgi:hypothetical protein
MNRKQLKRAAAIRLSECALIVSAFAAVGLSTASAQDIHFNYGGVGETKSMTHWGVDTAWPSHDNVRQTVYHMGIDQTDVVRINFFMDEPPETSGEIGPNSKARIDDQLALATLAGDKPLALTPATGDGTHSYYLDADGNAIPERWLALMEATQEYIGQPIHALEVFNEPDYWAGMGTPQTLSDIMALVVQSPNFQNTELHAASTLCSCAAQYWYDPVSGPTTHGTLHQLAGSADDYINFIQYVQNQGDIAYNPELHSMAEVLFGAEYGLQGGIWWGAAMRPRGVLVNAVQGSRLGYAELRGKSAAAAVYRAPDGKVYGFAGSFERHGPNHSFRYVADDQDVYYNGIGPLREFMMPTWMDQQGGFFNIEATPSIPALDGHRWKIVNRATGEVVEVEAAGTSNGDNIRAATDVDALHQKWDIYRNRDGYYGLVNANSGITAEVADWSIVEGDNVRQWGSGDNILQHWWIESTGDGYFYLHNGHSNLYMEADSASDNVHQWNFTGSHYQQWSFISTEPTIRGSMIAQYPFENNADDSTGTYNGTAVGSPVYTSGRVGQAVDLDGIDDYIDLPDKVASSDDITIATWVYWDGGDAWQRIFDFGVDTQSYMFLTPSSNTGMMNFSITNASNSEEQRLLTTALPTNQWVHVAVTLGGNTAILYIDGQPRVAGHIFMNPSDLFGSSQQQNYIGKSQWPDPTFNGMIDDFRIYDYALNAAEVAELAEEEDSSAALLEEGFESNFDKWVTAAGWDITTSQWVSGASSAHAARTAGDLTSRDLDSSGKTSISIQFWYRDDKIDDDDNVYLKVYNGTEWIDHFELGNTDSENTWHYYQTTITGSEFMIPSFKIKVAGESIDAGENFYIDDVLVTAQ